jgi:hypothetical protein
MFFAGDRNSRNASAGMRAFVCGKGNMLMANGVTGCGPNQ